MKIALMFGLFLIGIADIAAGNDRSPKIEVLVNGAPLPTYFHKGKTYLEAKKGKQYQIRVTNPLGVRVAVALSVDGLNSIDARHTKAKEARKWVLGPYETVVISGWQMNARQARSFYFTTEERSYGARLNKTNDLGIISAVFFREKRPKVQPIQIMKAPESKALGDSSSQRNEEQYRADAPAVEEMGSMRNEAKRMQAEAPSEYAATGIGNRIHHRVQAIHMDLEDHPFAAFNLRYEFRPTLVRLGVIPPLFSRDPIIRRERARGFSDSAFCPEP